MDKKGGLNWFWTVAGRGLFIPRRVGRRRAVGLAEARPELCTYRQKISRMKNSYLKYILPMFILAFGSCREIDPTANDPQRTGMEVRFEADKPFSEAGTRSQTPEESAVANVQVMVFENGAYRYTAQGSGIVNANNTVTFKAFLRFSSQPLKLILIANSGPVIAEEGETPEQVSTRLLVDFTPSGAQTPLVMFGSRSLPGGLNTLSENTLTEISLMRSMARVDMVISSDITNFVPQTIQVFRANSLSQTIPNTLSSDAPISAPSIPATSVATINTNPQTVTGLLFQSQLYLPESAAPAEANRITDATCVILGGYFNGSTTLSYYRMDFDSGLEDHPFGQILRNYRYILHVNSIQTAGFATPNEAAINLSAGIDTDVKVWKDNTVYMSFDPQNFLGVSSVNMKFNSTAGQVGEIEVDTNLNSYDMRLADENGNPITLPSDVLNNGLVNIEKIDGGAAIRVTTVADNGTGSPVASYLLLTSGSLKVFITITQGIFGVIPNSFTVSASGGLGYLLVTSTSPWGSVPNVDWLATQASGDSIKWNAVNNPVGQPARSGILRVANYDGDVAYIPFTQAATNTQTLRVHSLRSGLGYLGATSTVTTAEARAQGLKGILTNTANYGLTGKVNCGGFMFSETTSVPYVISPADTTDLSVFYSPDIALSTNISPNTATALAGWLRAARNRVMVICFDESNRNVNLLDQFNVTEIRYLATTGAFPLQFNPLTQPFTATGPFTVYPSAPIPQGFAFRNNDATHGEISVTANPSITPILLGPGGGIVLGVDYTQRVVYVGDVDLFNVTAGTGATNDNHIINITGDVNNNASRLIANVWAWIAQVCLSNP